MRSVNKNIGSGKPAAAMHPAGAEEGINATLIGAKHDT
jgi:hypothetical protein